MDDTKNSVSFLQSIHFATLEFQDKLEIKSLGRVTPDLNICQKSKSRALGYHRKFNSSIYMKYNWLTGCPKKNALFCFPCLLFGKDAKWIKRGITDLSHLVNKTKKHEKCAEHLESVCNLAMLGTADITIQDSTIYTQEINKHNKTVKKNLDIVSKIIDCILFCGKMELPLKGHDQIEDSLYPGVFGGLLQFTGKLDEDLKNHFHKSHIFKGSSETVQNELLDCILKVCRDEICKQIKRAKYLAIMVDGTTDVPVHAQHVIVFRYELQGTVYERFWGFFNTKSQNAKGLAECLLEQLKIVLCDDNYLIAQTYDGAAVLSGALGVNESVPKIIKKTYKNAHFVHCYAHQLNLILEQAASQNLEARIFFSSLAAVPDFFSKSSSRLAALNAASRRIPRGSNPQWNFNSRVVETVYENKECLQNCFESLQEDSNNVATVQAASGLIRTLHDENFNLWLNFFYEIMPHVDILYYTLENRNADSIIIAEAIDEFTNCIQEISNNLLIKQEEDCLSAKKPRFSNESMNLTAREVCDYIIFQAKERFAFTKHLSAARLFSPCLFSNDTNEISDTELEETVKAYPTLDKDGLVAELNVLYGRPEFKHLRGHKHIFDLMYKSGLHESFVEVFKLLKILLTTPMTNAEPEGYFYTLKRIKTFLRNTLEQDKLTALAMISIESNLISNIPNFNEKVFEDFINQNECMEFKYK